MAIFAGQDLHMNPLFLFSKLLRKVRKAYQLNILINVEKWAKFATKKLVYTYYKMWLTFFCDVSKLAADILAQDFNLPLLKTSSWSMSIPRSDKCLISPPDIVKKCSSQ